MAIRMPSRPTPDQFQAALRDNVLRPALDAVSGRDGRTSRREAGRIEGLDGVASLAAPVVDAYFERTGFGSSSSARVAREALGDLQVQTTADGRVDPARLPPHLQAVFVALGGQAPGREGPAPVEPGPNPDPLANVRYSKAVLGRVMAAYGLEDAQALLRTALGLDDGNRYLKRSELEAAAKRLVAGPGPGLDLGIISDLDKTIIPSHGEGLPPEAYPGVAQLLVELEAVDADRGDLTFVTARTPERVVDVPDWLQDHDVPGGPIETGVSGVPWIARAEKVRDISRVLDANPGKSFVMFGDTSHRDPEAYREIQEIYGERVKAAFIHRVTENVPEARVAGLYLIENYAEAAAHLHDLDVLDTAAARRVMESAQLQGLDITDAEIDGLLGAR